MRRALALLGLIAMLAVAGCASTDNPANDDNRFRGFYGGVNGGVTP